MVPWIGWWLIFWEFRPYRQLPLLFAGETPELVRDAASSKIVGETPAGATHHIMGTAFAGFFRLRVLKHMAKKFGVHFLHSDIIDLLVVLDIPQFKPMKRETIETIAFGIDVHRAVIGTTEV